MANQTIAILCSVGIVCIAMWCSAGISSIGCFILLTIAYYSMKPQFTIDDLINGQSPNSSLLYLLGYSVLVLLLEFYINCSAVTASCGYSSINIQSTCLYTFLPWFFIFGIMVVILMSFPAFKNAFANVIGYFAVAGTANILFTDILRSTDVDAIIRATRDPEEQQRLRDAAESILKICANKSILINQIHETNFLEIWNKLTPLMKPGVSTNTDLQNQLLNLVSVKDNIGECCWYILTGWLVSCIVSYTLAKIGCQKTPEQQKQEHDAYVAKVEADDKAKELNNTVSYTLDS